MCCGDEGWYRYCLLLFFCFVFCGAARCVTKHSEAGGRGDVGCKAVWRRGERHVVRNMERGIKKGKEKMVAAKGKIAQRARGRGVKGRRRCAYACECVWM